MTQVSDATCMAAYKFCGQANLRTVAGLLQLSEQLRSLASAEIQQRATVSVVQPIYFRTSWMVDNQRDSKLQEFSLEAWKSSMPGLVIQNRLLGSIQASFFGSINSLPVVTFVPSLQQLEINHGN